MPDPISASTPWLWGGVATVGAAFLSACATIFATRRNAEAAMMEAVTERFALQFDRYDAEIEDVRRHAAEERAECQRKLDRMQAEIDRLMNNPLNQPAPSYTGAHAERAERIGRAAQRRQASKGKPK